MVVIDWLQTSDFIRENSERFTLYFLCGCFIGIAIIFLTIIIVLYIEKRGRKAEVDKDDYQIPRNEILSGTRSYIPVYRYDGRTHDGLYQI